MKWNYFLSIIFIRKKLNLREWLSIHFISLFSLYIDASFVFIFLLFLNEYRDLHWKAF